MKIKEASPQKTKPIGKIKEAKKSSTTINPNQEELAQLKEELSQELKKRNSARYWIKDGTRNTSNYEEKFKAAEIEIARLNKRIAALENKA